MLGRQRSRGAKALPGCLVLAVLLIAVPGASARNPVYASDSGPAQTDVLCGGSNSLVYRLKPSGCDFHSRGTSISSEASYTLTRRLRWLHWGARTATAIGEVAYPMLGWYRVRIRLAEPRAECGRRVFTRARFRVRGRAPHRFSVPLDECPLTSERRWTSSSSGNPPPFERARTTAATSCPFATTKVVYPPGRTTFRFWRTGVSCAKVGHLFQAFFRHVNAGLCEGARCIVKFPGGWYCSGFSAVESAETGGAEAGCYKQAGVKFRAYPVMQNGFLSPDRKVWCIGNLQSLPAEREFGCVSRPAPGHRSGVGAVLGVKGAPQICEELTPEDLEEHPPPWNCFQNFDPKAPVLPRGSAVVAGGFRCSSGSAGITCTYGEGAARAGFVISQTDVHAL